MNSWPHYMPLLKGKMGEFLALNELSDTAVANITPLFEVPPVNWDWEKEKPTKTLKKHLAKIAQMISDKWKGDRPIFIDLYALDLDLRCKNGAHPLTVLGEETRSRGIIAIPTTGFDRDDSYNEAAGKLASTDNQGICLRLLEEDMELGKTLQSSITELLSSLEVAYEKTHVVLDFRHLDSSNLAHATALAIKVINTLDIIPACATLTVAASGFPEFPSTIIQSNSSQYIRRCELDLWETIISNPELQRRPNFGDYGVAHPDILMLDPRKITLGGAIRYSLERNWLVVRGGSFKKYSYTQYHRLARELVKSSDYAGREYCCGDGYIYDCAAEKVRGNPMKWRQMGTNRHLTYVGEQVATMFSA